MILTEPSITKPIQRYPPTEVCATAICATALQHHQVEGTLKIGCPAPHLAARALSASYRGTSWVPEKLRARFSASLAAVMCAIICSCALLAQSRGVYVDSQERFTIQVPPGWVGPKPFNSGGVSGVTIGHGENSYRSSLPAKRDRSGEFSKTTVASRTLIPATKSPTEAFARCPAECRMYIVGEAAGDEQPPPRTGRALGTTLQPMDCPSPLSLRRQRRCRQRDDGGHRRVPADDQI